MESNQESKAVPAGSCVRPRLKHKDGKLWKEGFQEKNVTDVLPECVKTNCNVNFPSVIESEGELAIDTHKIPWTNGKEANTSGFMWGVEEEAALWEKS